MGLSGRRTGLRAGHASESALAQRSAGSRLVRRLRLVERINEGGTGLRNVEVSIATGQVFSRRSKHTSLELTE